MGNQNSGEDSASYTTTDFDESDLYSLIAQSSRAPSPMEPPEADLSHLTEEERSHITEVLERARQLQDRDEQRVRELEEEYTAFAENIVRRASLTGMETDLCPICLTTELVLGAPSAGDPNTDRGTVCEDCERRVCRKCGSTAVSIATKKDKWLCHMCQKRRHLYTSSGMWYHGTRPALSRCSSVEEALSVMGASERRSSTPISEDSCIGAAGEERERKQLEHSESSEERPESESRSRGVGQSSSDEDGCKSSNAKDTGARPKTRTEPQDIPDKSEIRQDEQSLDNVSPSSTYDSGLGASTKIPSTDDMEVEEQRLQSDRIQSLSLHRQGTTESLDDDEMQRQLLDMAVGSCSLDDDEMQRQLLEMAGLGSEDQDETDDTCQTIPPGEISQSDDVPVGDRDGAYGEESPISTIPAKASSVSVSADRSADRTDTASAAPETRTETITDREETKQDSESAKLTQYILTNSTKNIMSIKNMIRQFEYKSASFDDEALTRDMSKTGAGKADGRTVTRGRLRKSGSLDSKTSGTFLFDNPVSMKPTRKHDPRWRHESLSDSEIRSGGKHIPIDTSSLVRSKASLAKSDSTLASKGRPDLSGLGTSISVESGIGSMESELNGKNGKSASPSINTSSVQDVQEGPEIRYQSFHDLRKVGTEEPTPSAQQTPQYNRQKPLNLPKRRRAKPVMEIPLSPIWDVEIVTPESDHPAGEFQSPEYSNPELAEESPIEPMAKVNYHEGEELCDDLTQKPVKVYEKVEKVTLVHDPQEMPVLSDTTDEKDQKSEEVGEQPLKETIDVHSTFGLQKRALDAVPEEPADFNKQVEKKEVREGALPKPESTTPKLPTAESKSEVPDVGAKDTERLRRTEKEYKSYIETFKQTPSKEDVSDEAEKGPEVLEEIIQNSSESTTTETIAEETFNGATTKSKSDVECHKIQATKMQVLDHSLDAPPESDESSSKRDITDQTTNAVDQSESKSLYNTMQALGTIATVVKDREGAIFVVSKYEEEEGDDDSKNKEKDVDKKDVADTSSQSKSDAKALTRRRHKPVPLPRTSKLPTLSTSTTGFLDEKLPISKTENDESSARDRRTRRTLPSTVAATKTTESTPTATKAGENNAKATSYGKYRSRSLDAIPQSKLPTRLGKIPEMTRMKSEETMTQSSTSKLPTKIPRVKSKSPPVFSRQTSTNGDGGSPESILESPVTPEIATKTFSEPKPSSPTQDARGKEPAFTLASPPREESRSDDSKTSRTVKTRASPPAPQQRKSDSKSEHERGRVPLRKQKESITADSSGDKVVKPPKPPVPPRKTIGTAMGKSFDGKLNPRQKAATAEMATETDVEVAPKPRPMKNISTAMGTSFDERRFMGRYSPRATTESATETYGQLSEAMRQKKAMLSEAVGTSFEQDAAPIKKQTTETGTSPPTPTKKTFSSMATGSFDVGLTDSKKLVESGTSSETATKKTVQTIATETSFEEVPKKRPSVEEKGTSPPSSPKITQSDLEQRSPARAAEVVLGVTTGSTSYHQNQLIFVSASQQRKSTDRRNHSEAAKVGLPRTVSVGTNTDDDMLRRSSIDQLLEDMDIRPSFTMSTYSDDEYTVPSVARARRLSLEDSDRRSSSLPSTPSRIPRSPSRSTSSDTEGFDSDADTPRKIRRRLPEIPPDAVPAPMPRRSKTSKADREVSEQEAERASELNKVKEMLFKKAEELERQRSMSEKTKTTSDIPGQRQEVTRITVRHTKLPTVAKKSGGGAKVATSVGATPKPSSIGFGNGAKTASAVRAKQAIPSTSSKRSSPPQEKQVSKQPPPPSRERFGYKRSSPTSAKQKQAKSEDAEETSNLTQMVFLTKSEEDIIREIEKQISDTSGTEYRAFEPAEIKREVRRKYADYIGHDFDLNSLSKLNTASSPVTTKESTTPDRPKRESPTQRGSRSSPKQSETSSKKKVSPTKDMRTTKQSEMVGHKRDSPTKDDRTSRSRLPLRKFTPTTKQEASRKSSGEQTRKTDDKPASQVPKYQYIGKADKDTPHKMQSNSKLDTSKSRKEDDKDSKDDVSSPNRSPKAQSRASPQSSPQRRRHRRQNSDPHVQKFSPIKEDSDFETQISAAELSKSKKSDKPSHGTSKSSSTKDSMPLPKQTRRRKDTPTVMPMSEEIIAQAERMSQEGEIIERKIKEEKREQLRKEIEKRKKQMEESARKLEEIKAMRKFDSQLDTVKTSYSYDDKLRNIETSRLGDHDRQYGSLETMSMARNMPNFSLSQSSSFNSSSDDMYMPGSQHLIFPLKSPQRTRQEEEEMGYHQQKKTADRQIHYDEITGSAVHIVQQNIVTSKDGQQQLPVSGMRRSAAFTGRDEIDAGLTESAPELETSDKTESPKRKRTGFHKTQGNGEYSGAPTSPSKAILARSKAVSSPTFRSSAAEGKKIKIRAESERSAYSSAEFGSFDFRSVGRDTDWSDPHGESDDESYAVKGSGSRYRGDRSHRDKSRDMMSPVSVSSAHGHRTKTFLFSRDPKDRSVRGNGLGLKIVGGKRIPGTDQIGAYIAAIYPGSVCEQVDDLREGDQVCEWNGTSLTGRTYEEVQQIIRSTDGEVELKVRCSGVSMCESPRKPPPSKQPSESYQSSMENIPEHDEEGDLEKQRYSPSSGIDPTQLTRRLEGISRAQSQSGSSGSSVKHSSPPKWPESPGVSSPSEPSTPKGSRKQHQHHHHREKRHHRVSGEIQLQIRYEPRTHDLQINIIRARGLAPKDFNGLADPFVKVYLLPGRSAENKRRTKYIARSLNPQWEQVVFYRNLSPADLQKKSIEFTVWDYDRFSPNDFMGEVLIDLAESQYLDNRPRWFRLHEHDENNSAQLPKPKTLSPIRQRSPSKSHTLVLQKCRSHQDVMDDQPRDRSSSRSAEKTRSLTQLSRTESDDSAKEGAASLRPQRPHMPPSFWKEDKSAAPIMRKESKTAIDRPTTTTHSAMTAGKRIAAKENIHSATFPPTTSSSAVIHTPTAASRKAYSPDEPHDAAHAALAAAEEVVRQLQPALSESSSKSYTDSPLQQRKSYISDDVMIGGGYSLSSIPIPMRRTLSAGDTTPSLEHLARNSRIRRKPHYGSGDTTDSSNISTPRSSRHSSRERGQARSSPVRLLRKETTDTTTSTKSSYYYTADSKPPSTNYGQADSYHMPPLHIQPQPTIQSYYGYDPSISITTDTTYLSQSQSSKRSSNSRRSHHRSGGGGHEKSKSSSMGAEHFPATEKNADGSVRSLPNEIRQSPRKSVSIEDSRYGGSDIQVIEQSETPWIVRQPPDGREISMQQKAAMYTRMLLADLGPGQVIDPEMPRQCRATFLKKANAEMTGEIKLALRKEVRLEGDILYVEIIQARKITYKFKVTDHLPDLYVKAYLVVGNKRVAKKKTRICKHDLEPTFNETFKYNTSIKGLALQIMLWADGGRFGRNLLVGEALIWLDTVNFSRGSVEGWYKLFLSPHSTSKGTVRTP
ncbi:uncharacterized protein [Ptychodera flava]|uniref:uncharacterized protein isoform X3 n=1 Tax=Ptychodera flava TaxID=63121 RepID=UPI00396A7E50